MSNAQRKGTRKGSAKYATRNQRTKNKAARIARDKARMKKQDCGHGSRHLSNIDETCKRCHGERLKGARQ